jgi:hypothetical protein
MIDTCKNLMFGYKAGLDLQNLVGLLKNGSADVKNGSQVELFVKDLGSTLD